jgi:carbon-monoxide dehydrogenase medium subunit
VASARRDEVGVSVPWDGTEEGEAAMIPPQFDYVRPADLGEALAILRDREGEAKLLGGGYSLIPVLKLRLAQPGLLVDLRDVAGLDGIAETDDWITIGGRATHAKIHRHAADGDRYPFLAEVARGIGDPQVRNWGTIGGSCAHADPASDWPAALIALRADVVCRSAAGERVVPAREFFVDTFMTALQPTEVITQIRIPRRPRRAGAAYSKIERKAGDFSTAGSAVVVRLGDDGAIAAAGIGLTGVSDVPFAATTAEAALVGQRPAEDVFRAAGAAAAAAARPVADVRGPVEYKRAMAAEMTVRALRVAVSRALAYG